MHRLIIAFVLLVSCTCYINTKKPLNNTRLKVSRSLQNSSISLKIVDKQHHLFIGRCIPLDDVLHSENLILNNDGKSQVNATIRMSVEGSVYITCVKVLDQVSDGEGAYPSFVGGGVGHNYVIFNVTAAYGRGFNFYVEIKGYSLDENDGDV
ncbi:hypothetical protein PPYR_05320 [Photinus pyralis]|uniref:Uncharacterized protein n=1 Tax=Photinus pyralis TaxID=7054 RepID=A0A5N4AUH5_PHOPY|nr:probable salivary secreted peptide [Photinus pyralis]KAB0800966.1 hypothetical protein PPYR_05320 [Photinus pyralis]